jgi:homocitrate synthase NifV
LGLTSQDIRKAEDLLRNIMAGGVKDDTSD